MAVEPFHLFRYLDEQAFRFNNREHERTRSGSRCRSRDRRTRLTYEELIGAAAASTPA